MTDAERVHDALRGMFENLCGVYDEARFERREGYDLLLFPAIPLPQFNGVLARNDEAAPALADALAEIEELGLPCSVQLREDQALRSAEEARRLGLTNEEHLPALVARPGDLSMGELDGLVITRVDGMEDREVAKATAAAGFGAPEAIFEPIYAADVFALDGFVAYVGRVGGEPVSTSIGYTVGDTVGIFNVATPEEHRGRGYGAAVTAAAARGGFANGAELAWLQSSAMGLSVYRRLGFREVATYLLLTR
jgi:ribosomal protein S18 acetylase RimI-like enzyme